MHLALVKRSNFITQLGRAMVACLLTLLVQINPDSIKAKFRGRIVSAAGHIVQRLDTRALPCNRW